MPYVPGFDYDLFISYAAADNTQGVVEEFVATLEKQISDNLVNAHSKEKVRVYFDREDLATKTGFDWEEQLRHAASSAAIFVPLLSPNYLSSPYCDNERSWFGTQPHASEKHPYAVAGWVPIGQNLQPTELQKAQRHPAGDTWLALLPPEERLTSCREFALKLCTALGEIRDSAPAVFLGPAAEERAAATRHRLMDELEKSGHRVVPDTNFAYENPDAVRAALKSSLLAIHFPGGGLDLEGLQAIRESFVSGRKTLLVQPIDCKLSPDESDLLDEINAQLVTGGRFAGALYSRLASKTDHQVWEVVESELRAAGFQTKKGTFTVGVACDYHDLAGAMALAKLIDQQGIPTRCPSFETAVETTEKMTAIRDTITRSQALILYWASAKEFDKRFGRYARARYKAKAWYLVPPLDPATTTLAHSDDLILRQSADAADLATLEPFLRELGWEPPA